MRCFRLSIAKKKSLCLTRRPSVQQTTLIVKDHSPEDIHHTEREIVNSFVGQSRREGEESTHLLQDLEAFGLLPK